MESIKALPLFQEHFYKETNLLNDTHADRQLRYIGELTGDKPPFNGAVSQDEKLAIGDLLRCRYQGIRPAVGYPCLPDISLNFLLDSVLDLSRIGIDLTEHGMMIPHASVSGLMFSAPEARYFAIGSVSDDQLSDYARRRGMAPTEIRKYIKC